MREEETLDQAMRRLQMEISKQKQDLEKIQEEQKSVSDRQKKASAQKEAQALRERYKEIVQRTQEAEKSLKEARSAFPKEVPTAQEMAALSESCAKMAEARTAAQTLELGETEKEKLQRLDTLFASGIPDKSEIKRLRQQIQNLDFLRREEDKNRLGESEAEELASYRQRFAGTQKATEALEDLQDLWSERSNRNAAFQALEESAKQRRAEKELVGKRHQVRMQAILAAGIVLTASGILLGVLKDFSLLSWLVLLIGALAAVAAVAGIAASGSADRQEIQATGKMDFESEQIQRIDQRISQTLQEMGLDYLPETFPETFHKLNREAIRYEDLLAKEKRAGQQSHGKEAQELSRQLQCFFAAYGRRVSEEDFGEKLHVLEADIGEIQGLQAKKHAQWNQKKRYREKREEAELLLRKLGYDATENVPALTAKIQEQLQLYQQRERILRTEQERKEQFEKASENRSLLKEPEKKPENLEELDERYQDLADRAENIRELFREYREQMRDFREKSDELALVGEELNELRKRQKSDLRKYELLGKTQEYLSQAKEALTARYIIPLKERYSLYYEKIADLSAEAFHLDANAQVTVEEKGMLRETQSLSAGFQDMVGLCLRLAFADVMYKDEKPPLILDDPFVNLDQDKLKGGKALLDELTEKYQILYLTCNESRK